MIEGGKTPLLTATALNEMGFKRNLSRKTPAAG